MSEFMVGLETHGLETLRYTRKSIKEKPTDIGFACVVGDKALKIFPNNLVEISDLEYIRAEDPESRKAGHRAVAYTERLSWSTRYPAELTLAQVKASVDFAFMSAGLPSIFFLTNLYLAEFATIEEERAASVQVFRKLYPRIEPVITELNATLRLFGQDLFLVKSLRDEGIY